MTSQRIGCKQNSTGARFLHLTHSINLIPNRCDKVNVLIVIYSTTSKKLQKPID